MEGERYKKSPELVKEVLKVYCGGRRQYITAHGRGKDGWQHGRDDSEDGFNVIWRKYFNNAELPISFYYTNEEGHAETVKPGSVPTMPDRSSGRSQKGKTALLRQ